MKKLAFLAVMAVLASCDRPKETGTTQTEKPTTETPVPTQEPPLTLADNDTIEYDVDETMIEVYVPTDKELQDKLTGAQVTVDLHKISGYGQDEGFGESAAKKLEKVLNSGAFKTAVTKTTFKNDRGLTPAQIYERIMAAHETSGPAGQDKVVDLRMRTMSLEEDGKKWMDACNRTHRRTIGKDGGSTGMMVTCPNWVRSRATAKDTASMAGHIAHEYMHQLGFTHPTTSASSVPYKVGYIVRRLAKRL